MRGSEMLLALLIGALFFVCFSTAHAADDVPALLRYAQQYDPGKVGASAERRDVLDSPSTKSRQAAQELQRRQLATRVKSLTAQLADKDKQLAILNDKLQTSVDEVRSQVKVLTARLAEKEAQMVALEDRQQGALASETQRVSALTTELTKKDKLLDELAKRTPAPVNLNSGLARQSYATGVLFGRDVQEARDANRQMGLKMDETLLLAGVMDALIGKPKMDEEALAVAQEEARKAAEKALVSTVESQKKSDSAWVTRFTKEKGVIKASEGYWYRVEHEGDGKRINTNDTVALVVAELLTDGTVVSDMEGTGGTLLETVSSLPPVFAGALGALKNHGMLTLVVPPELAYGNKGYPPRVPPGATMVYKLRVSDVIDSTEKKGK